MSQIVDIDNVGAIGVIKDLPDSELPVNAWTDARNIHFERQSARKMLGDQAVFEDSISLLGNPIFIQPVQSDTNFYWVYADEHQIYATDGDTHVNVSQSATTTMSYSTTDNIRWNGGVLNGFVVINNSFDAPAYWDPSLSNDFAPLRYDYSASETWADTSAAPKCKIIRPFNEFLVALDITENSVRDQRRIWWSHPAEAGDLPLTWDYSKTNFFAGQDVLADTQGVLIDALQLRDNLAIYKDDSIYRLYEVGLPDILNWRREIETLGALSHDCVQNFFGNHLVFGNGDVIIHNFAETKSILTNRMRRWLYSIISQDNYRRSFVLRNQNRSEMWLCFPETGRDYPNIAVVWNWETNSLTVRDIENIVCGASGIIDPSIESTTFDSTSGSFDTDFGAFGEAAFNPSLTETVIGQRSDTGSPHILQIDETNQFNGTNMTAYLERTCLPLGRQGSDGTIRIDTSRMKQITRIIPRIRASAGAEISIWVGTQDELDGAVSWKHIGTFDCDNDWKHDCRVSGRIMAIRFTSNTNISWSLEGYRVEFNYVGDR